VEPDDSAGRVSDAIDLLTGCGTDGPRWPLPGGLGSLHEQEERARGRVRSRLLAGLFAVLPASRRLDPQLVAI